MFRIHETYFDLLDNCHFMSILQEELRAEMPKYKPGGEQPVAPQQQAFPGVQVPGLPAGSTITGTSQALPGAMVLPQMSVAGGQPQLVDAGGQLLLGQQLVRPGIVPGIVPASMQGLQLQQMQQLQMQGLPGVQLAGLTSQPQVGRW